MVWLDLANDAGENLQLDILRCSSNADVSNLISVFLKGKTAAFDWQVVYPCFQIAELKELANWLTDLAATENGDILPLQFLDPSITFVANVYFSQDRKMQIMLLGDLHPQKWTVDDELILEFIVSQAELNRLSGDLKKIVTRLS